MTVRPAPTPRTALAWFALALAVVALVLASVALTATLLRGVGWGWAMMGGPGPVGPVMMRGFTPGAAGPRPGQAGFVAGTPDSPRVVRLWAGPGYAFSPSAISVARGETVTFEVTVMGPAVHEFMVGPADAVDGDVAGTPEIDGIGMMQTRSITFTFDGPGPYAFACHAAGHFEAGMRGTITVVG